MNNAPDPDLLALAASGDRQAMGDLIADQLPLLKHFVKQMMRRRENRNYSYADLLTVAMESTFFAVPQFKADKGTWSNYVGNVFYRTMQRRRAKECDCGSRPEISFEDVEANASVVYCNLDNPGPHANLEIKERREIVHAAVATLTPLQSRTIRERYGIGTDGAMTLDEVSQRRGVSRNAIHLQEQHAKRTLKKRLKKILA